MSENPYQKYNDELWRLLNKITMVINFVIDELLHKKIELKHYYMFLLCESTYFP